MCPLFPDKAKITRSCQTGVDTNLLQRRLLQMRKLSNVACAIAFSVFLASPVCAQLAEQNVPTFNRANHRAIASGNVGGRSSSILQPGDELELTVLGFPDLSGRQVILADGSIQIPLVGNVLVAGLTPGQAVDRLTVSLVPYVRRPQVGLTLLSSRPPQVSVTGEVRRPGAYLLVSPDRFNDNLDTAAEEFQTLTYALISAGGVTPNADLRNITVRRRLSLPGAPFQEGSSGEIRVNLWSLIQEGDLSSDIRLYNGDEIIIPTTQLANGDREKLLGSTLAPESISVQVAGAVRQPGQLQIAPDANIVTAVIAAGGFTEDAREEKIALFRASPGGQFEQKVYTFGEATEPLMDGDVIVVDTKKRRLRKAFRFIGSILNPLDFLLD